MHRSVVDDAAGVSVPVAVDDAPGGDADDDVDDHQLTAFDTSVEEPDDYDAAYAARVRAREAAQQRYREQQMWLAEAKYHAFVRQDWAAAASCLTRLLPDGAAPLERGRDWPPVFRLLFAVKHRLCVAAVGAGLVGGVTDVAVSFPVFAVAMAVRGVPGGLRLQLSPVHEAIRRWVWCVGGVKACASVCARFVCV